jgi:hypothetical protein
MAQESVEIKSVNCFRKSANLLAGDIRCHLKFQDNPNFVFCPGKALNGVLEVYLENPLRVQSESFEIKVNPRDLDAI